MSIFRVFQMISTRGETSKHDPAESSPHLVLKSSEKNEKYSFFFVFEGIISKPGGTDVKRTSCSACQKT